MGGLRCGKMEAEGIARRALGCGWLPMDNEQVL